MGVAEDWAQYIREQAGNLEKWAVENPMQAGFIIVLVATVGTFVASKAYDAWMKG